MIGDTHKIGQTFQVRKVTRSLKNDQTRIGNKLFKFTSLPERGIFILIAPDEHGWRVYPHGEFG